MRSLQFRRLEGATNRWNRAAKWFQERVQGPVSWVQGTGESTSFGESGEKKCQIGSSTVYRDLDIRPVRDRADRRAVCRTETGLPAGRWDGLALGRLFGIAIDRLAPQVPLQERSQTSGGLWSDAREPYSDAGHVFDIL